jgi:aryl-alcohol dehydrogenase-like predicted oxidoreductase
MASSRRDFLRTLSGATAAAAVPVAGASALAAPAKRSATDWVPLGNSGVKVTRLAFGTGTYGGRVQRELGQDGFTRLVRHAYDRGIRFFETADNYDQMHEMLAVALKGLPRDSYRLMTKFRWREAEKPFETLDRFRRETASEYFDIVLLHNVKTPAWPEELERLRDALSEAKHKKILLSHGASCHGLLPLRRFPDTAWLDVTLNRINHKGTKMDNLTDAGNEPGDVREVVSQLKKVRAKGTGMIGMKIMGEGRFISAEDRDQSVKFVMQSGLVDAVTIGYKSPAEIDEAIQRINVHLNS